AGVDSAARTHSFIRSGSSPMSSTSPARFRTPRGVQNVTRTQLGSSSAELGLDRLLHGSEKRKRNGEGTCTMTTVAHERLVESSKVPRRHTGLRNANDHLTGFQIAVSDEKIRDLEERIVRTRWPVAAPGEGWTRG